jgi:hypothetical protein
VTIFVGKPLTPEALGLVEAKSAQEIADRPASGCGGVGETELARACHD